MRIRGFIAAQAEIDLASSTLLRQHSHIGRIPSIFHSIKTSDRRRYVPSGSSQSLSPATQLSKRIEQTSSAESIPSGKQQPVLGAAPHRSGSNSLDHRNESVSEGRGGRVYQEASKRPIDDLSALVRSTMRRVPYPIAIVTAIEQSADATGGEGSFYLHGMTVNSFNTVCLTPDPFVSFNVRHPSSTAIAIQKSGRFSVHLLDSDPGHVTIARYFAGARRPWAARTKAEVELMQVWDQCYCSFDCQVDQELSVGDHSIMTGKVLDIRYPSSERSRYHSQAGMDNQAENIDGGVKDQALSKVMIYSNGAYGAMQTGTEEPGDVTRTGSRSPWPLRGVLASLSPIRGENLGIPSVRSSSEDQPVAVKTNDRWK